MASSLRYLYELVGGLSTATQVAMCKDFQSGLASASKKSLDDWFVDALRECANFNNVTQPFLTDEAIARRRPIGANSTGDNRIIHLLSTKQSLQVSGMAGSYSFTYVERQVPPQRVQQGGQPTSGHGGIDYIARSAASQIYPMLGEIKVNSDQNAFYAFIQLLTYLSEMATPNQIQRANQHNTFGAKFSQPTSFDLHILLADFNDRGNKGTLNTQTGALVKAFKRRLSTRFPSEAKWIGSVLCLKMDSATFVAPNINTLDCVWFA